MAKSNYYVVRNGPAWGLRREDASRLSRQTETQGEAIDLGRRLAAQSHGELRIQNRDGRFREAYSYGPDPYPPPG
ncbi:MAG: DUF2188 domain-containing protein [Lentisphaerae bacterium]|nr:DUF2188 domain-containing protein [Lentisphaerota bacterium]